MLVFCIISFFMHPLKTSMGGIYWNAVRGVEVRKSCSASGNLSAVEMFSWIPAITFLSTTFLNMQAFDIPQ